MIARRVLRDRSTPRNTVGTYEYNPVNEGAAEKRAGWASVRVSNAACVSHPDQIRRTPSAKIRGAGYELPSTPPREIIIRDR